MRRRRLRRKGQQRPPTVASPGQRTTCRREPQECRAPPIASEPSHLSESTPCAQKRTRALQQNPSLFDHLVGTQEQRSRDGRAKCLGGLKTSVLLSCRSPRR